MTDWEPSERTKQLWEKRMSFLKAVIREIQPELEARERALANNADKEYVATIR